MTWEVMILPTDRGVIVYLTDGKIRTNIGRVSYRRWNSTHPYRTFKRQHKVVVARGNLEADRLNQERV